MIILVVAWSYFLIFRFWYFYMYCCYVLVYVHVLHYLGVVIDDAMTIKYATTV